jgi:hypothetical protein
MTADVALGRAGQIAVVSLIGAGLVVGVGRSSGPVWLVPFVPFAGVGALLAVRRPRTSIAEAGR